MMKSCFQSFLCFSAFSVFTFSALAQAENVAVHPTSGTKSTTGQENSKEFPSTGAKSAHLLNIIKTNLTSILLKNYSLQYERVLSRKFSAALQYRLMPESGLPFKSSLVKLAAANEDDNAKKLIEDFKMSNYAITPEVRLYLSKKGYGRGFYIGAYYRYASFTSNDFNVFYTDDNNTEQSIKLSGKLTANTGGILLGVQHFWGKRVVLDVWILGPHYGSGTGNFIGVSSKPLSENEQNDLRDQLDNIDIPLTEKTINVNANGASLKLDGPWGGFRTGLSLGIKL
ncbi:MAG TPA: DUF3575 domain-containing protein [Chitinophagaceae bacterium]|nr:DUF3575 domain-containing protein [Chitinophagaceae bacterium]